MPEARKMGVSFYDEDVEIVQAFGKPRGLSFSSAVRMIIREWQDYKRSGVDFLPHPSDGQPVPVIYVQKSE